MSDDLVIKLDRSDVVDTSDMRTVIFHVETARPRAESRMPDDLAVILGRLVMGQAVQRADMAAWGVYAMRLYNLDELVREGAPGRPRLKGPPGWLRSS